MKHRKSQIKINKKSNKKLVNYLPNNESVENIILPKPTREQWLKRKQFKISNELSNKQIKKLDRKEFKQAINGTLKELTLYNNYYTLDYFQDDDINEWDSDVFYRPNKYLINKNMNRWRRIYFTKYW